MKLIVGLGNPGEKYSQTRHNIGFIVVDEIAKQLGIKKYSLGHKGLYAKTVYNGEQVILLKPQTFMNLSGESIRALIDYYKLSTTDLLVIFDDLDLSCGKLKLKFKGSSGGHNGLKSIEKHLGTKEYKRLKIGIGRNSLIQTKNYVLGKFTKEEQPIIKEAVLKATEASLAFIVEDFNKVMTAYN